MRDLLGRLRLDSVIVHEVPKRTVSGAGDKPTLSEVESTLNTELRNFFMEKINGSLVTAAYDVAFDPDTDSPVPAITLDVLENAKVNFVSESQKMAHHLWESQTGVNPGGLLTVIQLSAGKKKCLGVLKLEKEAGVRVQRETQKGKMTFSIEHVKNLMLTDKTKVFKAGLFAQEGKGLLGIRGLVSDEQRGYFPNMEVAEFFLKTFLGCTLLEAPDVTTGKFFSAVEDFINNEVDDSEKKARYQIGLLAELASQSRTVSPRGFAQRHMDQGDRQPFIQYMRSRDVVATEFAKDTTLIHAQLKRMQMDFTSGLKIVGPPVAFDEHVEVTDTDDGRARVIIEDAVRNVGTKK